MTAYQTGYHNLVSLQPEDYLIWPIWLDFVLPKKQFCFTQVLLRLWEVVKTILMVIPLPDKKALLSCYGLKL